MVVAPAGKTYPLLLDLLKNLKDKQAECLLISNEKDSRPFAEKFMPLPPNLPEWLSPIMSVIHGQIFAMNLALVKGHAVDTPRGLRKVTSTA